MTRWADAEQRLRSRLVPAKGGCLEYTGTRNGGYGVIGASGRYWRTHRFAWTLAHGPIPDGLLVRHKCDNRPCCNVEHLELGTNYDNVQDRNSRNRQARQWGETNGRARLTEADVREIRRRYAAGEMQRVIADDYGTTQSRISEIVLRKTWRWVL